MSGLNGRVSAPILNRALVSTGLPISIFVVILLTHHDGINGGFVPYLNERRVNSFVNVLRL